MKELLGLSGKTILVTGCEGMLGTAFTEILKNLTDVNLEACGHHHLDVTDYKSVLQFADVSPDIVIHCAAEVDAERCQKSPDECHKVQVEGTRNIVALSKATGAKILYPQSFLIFDGSVIPILETTSPSPISIYGKYKFEAEQIVRGETDGSLVVRMAGFFGGEEKDKNFVGKFVRQIRRLIIEGVKSYEVGDRVWQPTYTNDLAFNSLLLLSGNKRGVYNMASHGTASFYELAKAIVYDLRLNNLISIIPVTETEVTGSELAPRPAVGMMENRRLISEGLDFQRPWREALTDYLRRPYFQKMFAKILLERP